MLANQGKAVGLGLNLLRPVSAANTAAATSAWVDVRKYVGDLRFIFKVGAVTGTITFTIEDATDGSGTGGAGITPNEGALGAGAANTDQYATIDSRATRGWVRCVGTIGTGPSLVAVHFEAHPKYTA